MNAAPAVVHVPHAATEIPADVRKTLCLSDPALRHEVLRMTDWYTDELFALPNDLATSVRFPVSRLVLDPERFEDDAAEPMAQLGMGVIYERTIEGQRLREQPTPAAREALLQRFYRPHHAALTAAVRATLEAHGRCLVLDAHSFPPEALAFERDLDAPRPDICLGTDRVHTPLALRDLAIELFERAGFTTGIDRPFAGALVPASYFGTEPAVESLMVEVNRGLYLVEATGERSPGYARTAAVLRGVLEELVIRWARPS